MEEFITDEIPLPEEAAVPETLSVPEEPTPIKKRANMRVILAVCLAVLLLAAAAFFITARPRKYARAVRLYETADYTAAAQLFQDLGEYEDARLLATDALYQQAENLLKQEQYQQALAIYEALGNYEKSERQVFRCCYILGQQALDADEPDLAIEYLERAGDYSNAKQLYRQTVYRQGNQLYLKGKYDEAQPYFDRLEGIEEYDFLYFEEPQEAIEYLKTLTDPFEEVKVVVRQMHPYYEYMSYWNSAVQQSLGYQFAEVIYDQEFQAVYLRPSYYPGQRIIWAWESGDFSELTDAELDTYERAVELVDQAWAECEDLAQVELWLHDWICTNVEYDSPYEYVFPEDYVGLPELTCVGALLDGKANCQGYTDAFHLLGTLAGLEVCKVFGTAEGGGHCWNAVRLDGKLYTVDVTFNDTYCPEPEERTYIWYNNALDMNQYTVFGGVSQFDRMVFLEDLTHTYYTRTDMAFEGLGEAAYQLLRQFRKQGDGLYYAVVDEPDLKDDDFYSAVAANMSSAQVYSVQWRVSMETYKEDTYITVFFE